MYFPTYQTYIKYYESIYIIKSRVDLDTTMQDEQRCIVVLYTPLQHSTGSMP